MKKILVFCGIFAIFNLFLCLMPLLSSDIELEYRRKHQKNFQKSLSLHVQDDSIIFSKIHRINTSNQNYFLCLPPELIMKIFDECDLASLVHLKCSNKFFYYLIQKEQFFKRLPESILQMFPKGKTYFEIFEGHKLYLKAMKTQKNKRRYMKRAAKLGHCKAQCYLKSTQSFAYFWIDPLCIGLGCQVWFD